MVDNFETRYYNYKFIGKAKALTSPEEFIKIGVLSIFDRQNTLHGDEGKISEKEFKSVTKDQYNKFVAEMKTYYKKIYFKELEYHIPTYEELKNMLDCDSKKGYDYKYISESEIEEPIAPNSKIGQSNQASSGNCYQIASDIALDTNKSGQGTIKLSINKNWDMRNKGYYVTLYGAKDKNGQVKPRTYFISQKELKEAQEKRVDMGYIDNNGDKKIRKNAKKYTSGDADVVLLDIATEKYRQEANYKIVDRNKKSTKGYDDYLSTGYGDEQLSLISGKKGHYEPYIKEKDVQYADQTIKGTPKTKKIKYNDKEKIDKRLKYIADNKNNVNATAMFKVLSDGDSKEFKKFGLAENHLFTISSVDYKNNTVTIINPWYGKNKPLVLSMHTFKKYCSSISYINQNEPIEQPKPKKNDPDATKIAKEIYNQICGASRNNTTIQKLKQIDQNNAAQIITEYKKISKNESLASAIDNEWGLGISTVRQYVCRPLIKEAQALGFKVNIKMYNDANDIKSLEKFINSLVKIIYQKLS